MNKTMKTWFIAAASLILFGSIILVSLMMSINWDFTKLSTNQYETNNYEINKDFKSIVIDTDVADVKILPATNYKCSVACYEWTNTKHEVVVKDGILLIKQIDTRKWYEYVGINFETPQITIYVPQIEYDSISIDTSTGDVCVKDLSVNNIEFSLSTGDVTVSNVVCDDDFYVVVTTGDVCLSNIACNNFTSSGNTGDISLNNVIATNKISIERSTGDVDLDDCDASELYIETDTGEVEGTLLTSKVFVTKTDTGSVDVPNSITGGICEIITDTGDIEIRIKQ